MVRTWSGASGRWATALLGAVACAGLVACSEGRGSSEASATSPPEAAATPVPVAALRPPEPTDEDVVRLQQLAPELNERSARALLKSFGTSDADSAARSTLAVAEPGFERLSRRDVTELGDLFSEVYAALGSADREWMAIYVEKLRRVSLSDAESRRGRALLTQGVGALPKARRARLQAILEQAIAAELQRREWAREAAVRRAAAPPATPVAASAPRSAPPAIPGAPARPAPTARPRSAPHPGPARQASGPSAQGEAYWRSRMAQARARVTAAEQKVAALDAQAKRTMYGTATSRRDCEPPAHSVLTEAQRKQVVDCLKRVQNEPLRQAAERNRTRDQLDSAKRELDAAKKALADLRTEARRAGALPGWLR